MSIAPSSSSTTPTKNLGSCYTTLMIHQSPFGAVHQWGTPVAAPTFTPSPYIPLQAVTSTPIYTMEVSSSSRRIEKFNGRPGTISLREFKSTFSTMVCELELKYGANYTEAFAFKQLACYLHYEALDVYEQHSARILGVTQIPNPAYAIAIATAFQTALQAAIAHHGIVPNNPDPVLISITFLLNNSVLLLQTFLSPLMCQLLLIQWGNSFEFLSWNFQSKVLKKNSTARHLFSTKG